MNAKEPTSSSRPSPDDKGFGVWTEFDVGAVIQLDVSPDRADVFGLELLRLPEINSPVVGTSRQVLSVRTQIHRNYFTALT